MKRQVKTIEKKIMGISMALLLGTTIIDPRIITFAYADMQKVQAEFHESLSEDKLSSEVQLTIEEQQNQTVESVQLPDGTKVIKDNFQREGNTLIFKYTTTENKKLEYIIEYSEKAETPQDEASKTEVGESPASESNTELKTEKLSYDVSDIKLVDEQKLHIEAQDITYKINENIDFRKGVVVKDEDGKDITDQLDFAITDYNGLQKSIAGTYRIQYSVHHPVTKKEYDFSRNITLVANEVNKKSAPKVTGNVSVNLSSNNAVLKNPNDFKIGKSNQMDFNIMVNYQGSVDETNRSIEIAIPDGFIIKKVPELSEINLASNIEQKGNTIIVKFPDGKAVDVLFEISLTQDWEKLYDEASVNDISKSFVTEAKSDQLTVSDNFNLDVKEFNKNNYDLQMKTNYKVDDLTETNNATQDYINVTNRSFYLKIKKSAYTKTDKFKIILPSNISNGFKEDELEFGTEDYVLFASTEGRNGKHIPVSYVKIGDSYELSIKSLERVVEDKEVELFFTYGVSTSDKPALMYSGFIYKGNADVKTILNGVEENKGPFIVDTEKDVSLNSIIQGDDEPIDVRILSTNTQVNFPNLRTSSTGEYILKHVQYEFEIPYELKFKSFQGAYEWGTFYTNKGKVFNIKTQAEVDDIYKQLEDGEYINKFIFDTKKVEVLSWNLWIYSSVYALFTNNMFFDVRNVHEDGTPVEDGDVIYAKVKVNSNDSNVVKKEVEKEITLRIPDAPVISAPDKLQLVEGDEYDAMKDVKIVDDDGNEIPVTSDMITTTIPMDDKGKLKKYGNYTTTYDYTDIYGHHVQHTTTVEVNGKLAIDNNDRKDMMLASDYNQDNDLVGATYKDNNGKTIAVDMNYDKKVDINKVGLTDVTYKAIHPVNHAETTKVMKVYVHGTPEITVPESRRVSVNTDIKTAKGVSAVYQFVEDDGTITERPVEKIEYEKNGVLFNDETFSSSMPSQTEIVATAYATFTTPTASFNFAKDASYTVIFSSRPEITVSNPQATISTGVTFEQLKNIIHASAFVHYGDETTPTDLTSSIDWEEVKNVDTSKPDKTTKVKIYVTDKDGVKTEQEITIHITKHIVANLPTVNKVVGEKFDPKEDVTIIDGLGKIVDLNDVTIDDRKVDMSIPGNYEVSYKYTDSVGNKLDVVNMISVHGQLVFNKMDRVDLIREDGKVFTPTGDEVYYINSDGDKKVVSAIFDGTVNQGVVGLTNNKYSAIHPVNNVVASETLQVYVHGELMINRPKNKTVKVNTEIDPIEGATASYKFVEDNGDITVKNVDVKSTVSNPFTSKVALIKEIPLEAKAEVKKGLSTSATAKYQIIFNGIPTIQVTNTAITVKVGATIDEIKTILNASASVQYGEDNGAFTDLTSSINWDELDKIDTTKESASYKVNIHVTDKDGETVKKEIKINVSKKGSMNLPIVNKVVGEPYDAKENVTVTDGYGNDVNINDVTIDDSKVDTTKPGNYEVTYAYKDNLGNQIMAVNTVHIHGKLVIDDLKRDDVIRKDNETYLPTGGNAYYINSDGNKIDVIGSFHKNVDQSEVGLHEAAYKVIHPINSVEETRNKNIYVHGELVITPMKNQTVKVNSKINSVNGATASYKFVEDDGKVSIKDVAVTSVLGDTYTSSVPSIQEIPLQAQAEIVSGLTTRATSSYHVTFNGLPEITVSNSDIVVKVGASLDEIKTILNAHASVLYGDDANKTDLTSIIDWKEISAIDTSKEDTSHTVKIYVTDADGVKIEKEITIKVSKKGIINVPVVNKVVGDTFDAKENVSVFDSDGSFVDIHDITINDQNVDMKKAGNYDVSYEYTDSIGHVIKQTNTIHVHGKLEIEGEQRVDLKQESTKMLISNDLKAFYMNSDGKKVYVEGINDKVVDQSKVGLSEIKFTTKHPINHEEKSQVQKIYIHGDIAFTKPDDITDKVGESIELSKHIYATFDKVNDDGSITATKVPLVKSSDNVTSAAIGIVDTEVEATITIHDLVLSSKDKVRVSFDGYPYIDSISHINSDIGAVTIDDIKGMMNVFAGLEKANGSKQDLTEKVTYINLDKVDVMKAGTYYVTLQVKDEDEYTATKTVVVNINQKNVIVPPVKPEIPETPNVPVKPEVPSIPVKPSVPISPTAPIVPVEKEEKPDNKDTSYVIITKDIPLSELKNGVNDELLKSYITARGNGGITVNYEIISNNVKSEPGSYEVTIKFADGNKKTVGINVVDEKNKGVEKPEYGRNGECYNQWFTLLLLLGYSVYAITAMLKRQKDIKALENKTNTLNHKKGEE